MLQNFKQNTILSSINEDSPPGFIVREIYENDYLGPRERFL